MIRITAYAVLNINVFVLAKVDLASAGFYGFAMQLVNKPTDVGISVMNRVLLPAYSALARSGGALMNALRSTMRLISIPAFGTFTALFSISPLLITFLYGAEWKESILLAQILISYGLLRTMSEPASNLLISVGAPGAYLKVYVLALAVQLVFLLPLMSVFGNATGCALDLVLSFAVHATALFYTVSKRFGTPSSAVVADMSAVLIGAPMSIAAGYVISSILPQTFNWWVFLAISMLTFIGFLSVFARADMLKTASYARESLALIWRRGA
jgi:O-antigen/teichoic acid export membrane protein